MRNASSLVCALALACTGATIARSADAQAFGNRGDMAFSAERLMGVYFYDEPPGGPGPQPSSSTHIGLGIAPIGASASPYLLPRLGFDYFVIDNLSIGGSLGFGDFDPEGNNNATTGAMIAPRVGYALEFSKVIGFWPRGGFTYRNFGGNEEFALTLEAMFYAAPVEHFAITFGPLMDLGIAGSGGEAKNFALLSAGLLGWI
jgi:hypothetical protein